MWNLSSIAQKAKEAAARLESQLDDSVGIKDESGFSLGGALGVAKTSSSSVSIAKEEGGGAYNGGNATASGVVSSSSVGAGFAVGAGGGGGDNFNVEEEDDFFSESHHERLLAEKQQLYHQQNDHLDQAKFDEDEDINFDEVDKNEVIDQNSHEKYGSQNLPAFATKNEVGHNGPGKRTVDPLSNAEEPLDAYDEDAGDTCGWDEADDIPFDVEEEIADEEMCLKETEQNDDGVIPPSEPNIGIDDSVCQSYDQDEINVVNSEVPLDTESPEFKASGSVDMNEDSRLHLEKEAVLVSVSPAESIEHSEQDTDKIKIPAVTRPVYVKGAPTSDNTYVDSAAISETENDAFKLEEKSLDHSIVDKTPEHSQLASIVEDEDSPHHEKTYSTRSSNFDSSREEEKEKHPAVLSEPILPSVSDNERNQYLQTIDALQYQLEQREGQLASKSSQITSLTLQHESESTQLRQIITETKEEAKKRILRARERVEDMQTKLTEALKRAESAGGDSREQEQIIKALREEGEGLARKQSQMEQAVRNARGEARELKELLEMEKETKEAALKKIEGLEKEVKSFKEELSAARKGESLSKKLEAELVTAKEESEKQRATNLVLEQQLKELREENKSLRKDVEDAKAGAALESERESNKLKKERDDMLSDLENKLRTSEREANAREDALRHEVTELRKRWQDAVRRAEDLNMDVQHSTAPLLRQLEGTERQNRARAAAWAELETKLRSDLEEHVIQSERLTKERNNLRASEKRLNRSLKEKEEEIASSIETIEALSSTIETLEAQVEDLEVEEKRLKEELVRAERQASDGLKKARNDIMKTMIDSEERYLSQIAGLEERLENEREKRGNLEKQLDILAQSVEAAKFTQNNSSHNRDNGFSSDKEKKLRATTNQASILHDTLVGFDSEDDDEEDEDINSAQGFGSFAAMEQLSLGLKGSKLELEALRKQLASSEEIREGLLTELGEAKQAAEKLSLFEERVSELTMEVKLKDMEIKGLQDDIADVKSLYRSQLDALLEEKAAEPKHHSNPPEQGKSEENIDGWDDF